MFHVEIMVLGPLDAREGGRSVVPTAAKPRQVLSMLAMHVGDIVPVPSLIEELWGEKPPRSAMTTLQTYIMQLRRLITSALPDDGETSAKDVLHTRFGGYLLDIPTDGVDAYEFERLATAGERAFSLGDDAAASRLLRQAETLWRGGALVDVATGMPLGIEVVRLEERKLAVTETRIDAELRLGQHQMLLSELSMLTARHPMNESLCAKYMLALYRAGRQWKALEAYGKLRDTLVDELGVDPSSRMRQLHQLVLASDEALDSACTHHELTRPALRGA